jgi:GT2 family glycosyltransferase
MEEPVSLVSVVIPAFNQGRFLRTAIDNALAQTHPELQVIVVDDGSTDDTPVVCAEYASDPRVVIVRQQNGGVGVARNEGARVARGVYLTFLDADDFFHPEKCAVQAALMDAEPDVAFTYCDIVSVGEDGTPAADAYSVAESRHVLSGDILPSLVTGGYFPPHAVMMRREVFDALGGFDPSLGGHADLDLWMRAAASGHAARFVDRRLACYRSHAGSMSRDRVHMAATRTAALAKLARMWPEQLAAAISAVQESCDDLHRTNQWLSDAVGRLLAERPSDPETLLDVIAAVQAGDVSASRPDRIGVWDVTMDGDCQRAVVLHPPGSIEFDVADPSAMTVTGAVALHPDVWEHPESGACQFEVTVDDRVRWTCLVDPARAADRGWLPFSIDVPSTASGRHRVRFETSGIGGNSFRWALWRAPRCVQASFSSQKLQPYVG